MTPAEVPDELVKKAARALGMWAKGRARDAQKADVRTALAAVLPEIQAQARLALLEEMRDEVKTWHVYDSRDIGDAFLADSVVDLIQDRIDHLREGSPL